MSWLTEEPVSQKELAQLFRDRIKQKPAVKIPGVHDSMSALIARNTGFDILYLSGAAYTASRGLPDLGIIHSHEVAERARYIVRAAFAFPYSEVYWGSRKPVPAGYSYSKKLQYPYYCRRRFDSGR